MATIQKVSGIDFANISKFDGVDISAVGSINFIGKPPTGNLLLDTSYGSGAEAAYSVRKLRTAYTGAAIQVQRTVGSFPTQEIGFDVNGNLDTVTLLAYASGNEVGVSIWYDQSLNLNNATQISVALRPIVVAAGGALVEDGGRVALTSTGSTSFGFTRISDINSVFSVLRPTDFTSSSNSFILGDTNSYDYHSGNFGGWCAAPASAVVTQGANYLNGTSVAISLARSAGQYVLSMIHTSNTARANSISQDRNGQYGQRSWDGNRQEIIIYSDDRTNQRTDIEENVSDYYTQNPAPYLLDTYTGAAAAYSLRKLRTDYTGFAIKVQDNVGGATQDIGFNVFGELDTVSLVAYAGSNDVFVETWYDQSGSGNNATQPSSGLRPKIYDGTTGVFTENSKPAISASGDVRLLTGTITTSNDVTIAVVTNRGSSTGTKYIFGSSVYKVGHANTTSIFATGSGDTDTNFGTWSANTQVMAFLFHDLTVGSNSFGLFNGGTSNALNLGANNLNSGITVFSSASGGNWAGNGQEIIIWNADQSANRTNIETNINTFYDIYTPTPDPLLLNLYPGSAAAYSLRKLNANYTGSAILVQDTVGGATKAIGFDANGDLDTAELLAYAGSNDVFVDTWYDQSGSGDNVTQGSSGARPQIVSSGAVIVDANGKPSIYFVNGTKQLAKTSGWGGTNVNTCDIVNVHRRASGSGNPLFWHQGSFQAANYGTPSYGLGWGNPTTGPAADTNQNIFYGKASNTVGQIFLNNVASAPGTLSGTRHFSGSFAFQGRPGYLTYSAPEIYQQEFIQWDLNQSDSDRTGITENIGGYYDIVFPGILDENPGAAAAYSLRRLSSTYTGSAVQVQRADNVGGTTDIGFDGYGDLDTAALTTAAQGNDMVVATWYDQSGNGNDATQSSSLLRPKIYDATTGVEMENGKPAVEFDGSSEFMNVNFQGNTNSAILASLVMRQDSTSNGNVSLGGSALNLWTDYSNTIYFDNGNQSSNRLSVSSPSGWDNNQHLVTAYSTGSNQYIIVDGSQLATKSITTSTNASFLYIGKTNVTSANFGGAIQEIVVYAANESDNRPSIEENIGGYYDIPLPGLLDENSGAAAAYSLRRLSSTYTGSAIQVQRADNVGGTHEIGFDSYGDLDTTALATAADGNTMVVATWYDQSGNSNNAVQATSANRPKIYDATTGVVTENGKPAVQFDGADDNFTFTTTSETNNCFVVQSTSDTSAILFSSTTVNNKWNWIAQDGSTSTQTSQWKTTSGDYGYKNGSLIATAGTTTRDALHSALADGNQNLTSWFDFDNAIASTYYLGRYRQAGFEYDGKLQEVILYTSDQSDNRLSIEDNIGGYYDIPLAGLLDENPGAAAAYSLRRLSSTYTGSAVQVQRADNVGGTTDIGFDSYGDLDTAALTTAAAGNSMVVTTWYDQSGSGNNATQGTSANRPKIYDGTTGVVTENGKPAVEFNGTSTEIIAPTVGLSVATCFIHHTNFDANARMFGQFDRFENSFLYDTVTGYWAFNNGGINLSGLPSTTSKLVYAVFDNNGGELGINGATATSGTLGVITGQMDLRMGRRIADYWKGTASELIVYDSDQSDNRPSIEENIGGYYDIPLAGLLDENPGAAAAYSLRRLSSTYTGSAIQVQRADNVGGTTDIGFDGYGDLDTAALTAAAQGKDMVVVTWFDQSGNSNDATQSSSLLRPKIYDGTTGVVTENGKPAVDFFNDYLSMTSDTSPLAGFMMMNPTSVAAGRAYIGGLTSSDLFGPEDTTGLRYRKSSTNYITSDLSPTGNHIFSFVGTGSSVSIYQDGTGSTDNPFSAGALSGINQIFRRQAVYLISGRAQEIILYESNESDNRLSIEDNVGDYYGIEIAGLLDQYSGAAAGYSLRKLSNSYTGFAVKVQDNVGGATQDIGFNADGELDTVALLAYAGSNDVFVETWYDQSGNGVNATQPSSGLRPQIVSSGAVIVENGKPALETDGANGYLSFTSLTFSSNFCFLNVQTTSLKDTGYGGAGGNFGAYFEDSTTLRWRLTGSQSDYTIPTQTDGTQYLAFINRDSSIMELHFQGVSRGTTSNAGVSTFYDIMRGNAGGLYLDGHSQELIFWNSAQSSDNRTGIEDNINFFYDIY